MAFTFKLKSPEAGVLQLTSDPGDGFLLFDSDSFLFCWRRFFTFINKS